MVRLLLRGSSMENATERESSTETDAPPPGHAPMVEAYAGSAADELPIGGYAVLMGAFLGAFSTVAFLARAKNQLGNGLSARDVFFAGVAVHKLSRTLTRERVTVPLRVPFTHYAGTDGAGQVREQPRGRGLQLAIGNLVTCQYCAGPWLALAITAGLVLAPRATRLANGMLGIATLSDFLHQAYAGARRWST